MPLATLSIDLIAQLSKLQEGFDRATRMSEKAATEMDRRIGAVKGGVVALGGALTSAFATAQIGVWLKSTVDGVDKMNDLKDATGSSIENISALEDVAARTGTTFESMSSTLIKFNKVLAESKPNSETAEIFKKLGLSAEELKRIDPAEALRQAAVALEGFASDGDKARIVQQLFGKSVAEAAPFLKDLAEQGKLNAKVTTEQAQAAEDFNKALAGLQKNSTDAARGIMKDFVPALAEILKKFNNEGLSAALNEFGNRAFDWEGSQTRKQIKWLEEDLVSLKKEADAIDGNFFERFQKLGGAGSILSLGEDQQSLAKKIQQTTDALSKLRGEYLKLTDGSAGGGRGSINPELARPGLGAIPDPIKPKVSELDKYLDRLEKAREATLNLSTEEQAYLDIYLGRLGKVSAEQEALIIGTARQIDERKKLAEAEKQLQAILDSTPSGKLETTRKTQIALAAAYEKGRFGIVGSEEALRRYAEAVSTTLPEITKEWITEIEAVDYRARELAESIDALLGSGLENTLSGNYKNILKDWESLLSQMAIQAARAQLSQYLLGSDYGKTGYVGGALGNLFGTGGTYPTGGVYDGGYSMPSAGPQSAVGGRQSVVHNHVYNVQAGVNRSEVISALRMSEQAQEARTTERLRRAGVA